MTTTTGTSSLLNTSGISVGSDGKIKVSGLSSGIDTQALIQAQLTADSVPITNIQTKITANNNVVSAYNSLKTKVTAFQTSLDALRNNLAYGSTNVFNQKTATGTATAGPSAPPGYTPSEVNSLLGTSFSSKAQTASHTITIEQLAAAQQIASDSQSSTTTDLSLTGTLTINGKNVTVQTTDSLVDIRDKINAAGANVNATIVSADATHNYLLLTSTTSGTGSNAITLTQTALSDSLGITNGSATPKNEKVPAADAIIDVDGITGITRSSNTISDVIDGVTLNLTKAEPNTVINLNITADLNAIKTAIASFVTAYNDLRSFISEQNTSKDRSGAATPSTDTSTWTYGPLYNNSILRGIGDQLSFMNATQMTTNTDGYQSLGQIGVVMGTDYTLNVDDSVMDPKLLSNVGAVAKLFGFNFTSSDSRVTAVSRTASTAGGTYYLSFNGTDGSGLVTDGRIATTAGAGTTTDGSLVFQGSNVVTAASTTSANGLVLGFNNTTAGLGPIADIQLTVSRGIADSFFDYFDQLTKTNGTLDTEVASVNDQNSQYQSQVDTLNTRLDLEKTNLTNKYAAMEAALSQLTNLQNQIKAFFSNSSGSSGG